MTATEPKPPRSWDFLLTTALIFLLLALAGIFVVLGVGIGVATLGCHDAGAGCNTDVIGLSSQAIMFGSPVVALVAIVVSIVFISKRRVAFWVPIAGILVITGLHLAGAYLVGQAVP